MNQKSRPKELGMLVVVGGPGSSGSSTIAKMLAEYFHLKRIYGGSLFRERLDRYGYEDNEKAFFSENEPMLSDIDKRVDRTLEAESMKRDVLIESKVFAAVASVKDIHCTVKIWVDANIFVRAQRGLFKNGIYSVWKDIPGYFKNLYNLTKRYWMDRKRYNKLYGINYECPKEYNDIVIDCSHMNENQTFNLILKYIEDGRYIK